MERLDQIRKQMVGDNQINDQTYPWVQVCRQKTDIFNKFTNLKDKVIVITGGSRGIGLEIAKKCAADGAKIAIMAKTVVPNPKMEGTIYTASEIIKKAGEGVGGEVLPIQCDIRFEDQVKSGLEKVLQKWGGKIDILINNASAILITNTQETTMKKYDLSHEASLRGTFMVSKLCLPYLIESGKQKRNPQILNLSPPFNFGKEWAFLMPYGIQKWGMSMCALGMSQEFKIHGIGVNALWPRTTVATAVLDVVGGGETAIQKSFHARMMADSAYVILTSDSTQVNGLFLLDDEVLAQVGIIDFNIYKINPQVHIKEMTPDLYV